MAWSGGSFSRVHDWTTDAGSAIDIEASRMDAEDDNFATGIDACLHKGGQNTATGDLPMGGNRHTGVDNAAARTDYASAADVQDQDLIYAVDSGAADAYVITLPVSLGSLEEGQRVVFRSSATNTGASTINVNSLGATAIETNDGSALVAGMIVTGGYYELTYDANGTRFVMTSPHSLIGSISLQDTINDDDWSGTDLAVANGGTGSSTASNARTALGVAIGSNVQAYDADLSTIAALTSTTDGSFIVGSATGWVQESGATVRTSLGLGSLATASNISNSDWSGTDLAIANGGTAASDAATALSNLGGQPLDSDLTAIAALAKTDGNVIVGNGTAWVAESGATARTSLGLGTSDSPQFTGINVGHASDTTITRDAAGQIAVGGAAVFAHNSGTYTSANIFFSNTTEPTTEGDDGDIFLVY